ncbi:alkaline phosphatase D family protein [Luteipulveratus flavus]|uniref:Alkaline phosphatase D family protein n=1 Tax=Luteipulveratus flavus TaxID=3031728 RepID=A0ABT6CCQ5_9MICO|nr:alkaline phosphatase D family protein [Luteipulveratus sp. YIM 133296]MDF8266293.1 alkaline phosphatase D family protein [Luteipulveratus sp. YIM 133296]
MPQLSRRHLIGLTGATGLSAATVLTRSSAPAGATPWSGTDPFTLGVASGDPAPDGVVLWTRLAPSPLAADGRAGMGDKPVQVQWQVATDPTFKNDSVVRAGSERAVPELAHSVHVELSGLLPDREYWYRFRAGNELSPVGRTRTAPAYGAELKELRFAFTSCQNLPAGYFTAYRHMAQDDLDLVVHLGDYIYEGVGKSTLPGRSHASGAEIFTLPDYRLRYSQYKTDPDLRAAHAAAPWIVTPDDHEVENNYANDISEPDQEPDQDRAVFLKRRAAAYQAYYEHMPLRRRSMPTGPDMQLYRRIRYGRLAEFNVLDTRQYRDDQLEGCAQPCTDRYQPGRTMLGAEQESWLTSGLSSSTATWKVLANQVVTFDADGKAGPAESYSLDTWMGYANARQRWYDVLHERKVENTVVITGDAHRSATADLKLDYRDQASPTVGVEFLGTSISSGGNGADMDATGTTWLSQNPHLKFASSQRGYQRCVVTPGHWRTDYRVVSAVTTPDAPIADRAEVYVEAGRPGVAGVDRH